MNTGYARRGAGGYVWFATALIVLSAACAARAAAPAGTATPQNAAAPESTANPDAASSAAPAKAPRKKLSAQKKPTIEELEQRIQLLERKLEAQQETSAAALRSAIAAQSAATAAQTSAAAAQQANTATTQQATAAVAPATAAAPAAPVGAPAAPAGAPAQQHPVTEQGAATATVSKPQIFAGPGGFSFQSPDGANQIRFHGEFDFDGRFYNDNLTPDGSRSTWLLRRARPIVEGTFDNIFDFRFNPDFAGGKTVIQDAFVAARFNPLFVVTAGKFKEPFGLERLQYSTNNRFIELGLPSDIVPNRDLGLQVSGSYGFSTGTLLYQIGWFNGVSDGVSTDANATPDVDNNDKKDWVARLFAQPFVKTDWAALRGLGAGAAVSYANQVGSASNTLLPTYKTETQRNFFTYATATNAAGTATANGTTIANGERLRISPQAYYYYKSFGLLSEYVDESQDVSRTLGSGSAAVKHRARLKPDSWQLMATYLVTGDDATFGTVVPKRPFAVGEPGWGAVELAARISQLKLDPATFTDIKGVVDSWFADPSTQANKATAWTVGVNWYLTQNVEWVLDYTVTRFDGGAVDGKDRADESAFFTRFQVAF
jgi:phosphate-selective porin OprO/OprP